MKIDSGSFWIILGDLISHSWLLRFFKKKASHDFCSRKFDSPKWAIQPNKEHTFEAQFHPSRALVACATITGEVWSHGDFKPLDGVRLTGLR